MLRGPPILWGSAELMMKPAGKGTRCRVAENVGDFGYRLRRPGKALLRQPPPCFIQQVGKRLALAIEIALERSDALIEIGGNRFKRGVAARKHKGNRMPYVIGDRCALRVQLHLLQETPGIVRHRTVREW